MSIKAATEVQHLTSDQSLKIAHQIGILFNKHTCFSEAWNNLSEKDSKKLILDWSRLITKLNSDASLDKFENVAKAIYGRAEKVDSIARIMLPGGWDNFRRGIGGDFYFAGQICGILIANVEMLNKASDSVSTLPNLSTISFGKAR